MGQWLLTTQYNNDTLSTTTTATTISQVQTRALPKSNFLARMGGNIRVVGVGTPTFTLDKVKVLVNSSQAVLDVRGGLLRAIQRYEQGSSKNGVLTSTTDLSISFQYQFGRFLRDTQVILPPVYRAVDLQLSYTYGASTSVSLVALDLWTEEYVGNDDPTSKLIKRILTIDVRAPGASSLNAIDITPGGLLRSIYMWIADLDNIGALQATNATTNVVQVVGNGSDIPYTVRSDLIDGMLVGTYRFDDGLVPTAQANDAAVGTGTQVVYKIDFDLDDSLSRTIDTNRLNRLQVIYQAAASGQTGNVEITQEDIVPVRL